MRILMIQLGTIGDMVLSTPIFEALIKEYTDLELTIIASRRNHYIIQNNPKIHKVIINNKSPWHLIRNIIKIRSRQYDYYIDYKDHYSRESSLFALLAKARTKIGFNKANHNTFDIGIPSSESNSGLHYVNSCFNALKPLGIELPTQVPKPLIFTSPDSDNFIKDKLSGKGVSQYVFLNISSGDKARYWGIENWINVLKNIELDKPLLLSAMPGDIADARKLIASAPSVFQIEMRGIMDVVSAIKYSNFVITPDTSIVHIAASFNKPIVALYNGRAELYAKFYPLSDVFQAVNASKGEWTVENIKPKQVIDSINDIYYP